MVSKAIDDGEHSKSEALRLRKQLDLFLAEVENTDVYFEQWRLATMKGLCKGRFQKSRSTTIGKRKVFNTRFDVSSQGDESSKTPSSSTRFSGPGCSPNFCDSPSFVNTGKKVEDYDAQALRQLELCLRVHAKIASGVYPSPPPGTLSGPVRSVTSGSMSRADGRSDVSQGGVSSRVSAIVDGIEASGVAGSCARVSGPDAGVAPPVRCLGSGVRVRAPCPAAENTFAYNKCDLEEGFDTPSAKA